MLMGMASDGLRWPPMALLGPMSSDEGAIHVPGLYGNK